MKALAASLEAPVFSSTASWRMGRIERLRHHPARSLALAGELRQGDEAKFGIAGVDELEGLGDVVALHELRLQRLVELETLQRLDGRRAIRSRRRIGDRQLDEGAAPQRRPRP